MSGPFRFRSLAGVFPQHDPCVALVGPVRHRPVEHDDDAVAEADQEEKVRDQPEPPRQQSAQPEAMQVHDRREAPDRGEVAEVFVAKRSGRPAGETSRDREIGRASCRERVYSNV